MGKLATIPGANLAAQINTAHRQVCSNMLTTLKYAAECGRLLNEAKKLVPHGEWLKWMEENTEVGERRGQNYMKIADHWPEIEAWAKAQPGADLGIKDALKLIAKPKPSPGTVQVIEHDGEDEGDYDPQPSMRRRGVGECCSQGYVAADDAGHHVAWLLEHGAIDDEALAMIRKTAEAWGRVHRLLAEKRASTLPEDGSNEVAMENDLGDIPACLDRRKARR